MRKLLTRAALIAVLSGAGMTALADNVGIPYYVRGPRIIHVPQPGEDLRDSQASLRSGDPQDFDNEPVSVVPPRHGVKPAAKSSRPKAKSVAKASTHRQPPHRKPYSAPLPEPPPPEPLGPRRALLSAPPPPLPSIHDGPTPLRATPRFGQPLPEPVSPTADAVSAAMPAPEPAASAPADASDDHLPPPGDPRLAPPEPAQ